MARDKKIRVLSGFPEWLPWQRMVEQRLIARLAERFETCGFAPIETRAVEPLDLLAGQGDTSKEIYALRRAQATEEDAEALGLHFDLTVPFARYALQHRGQLSFPFRRYQVQKVWRGERPQAGRFREFYQADLDVIGDGELPLSCDIELPRMLYFALEVLPVPPVTLRVNHRALMEGYYRSWGIERVAETLRAVDKLDKIGPSGVRDALLAVGHEAEQAEACLRVAELATRDPAELAERVRALVGGRPVHPALQSGLNELGQLLVALADLPVIADLRIARGLDYYTGLVFEGTLDGHEDLGAVCSGGRYDDLAEGAGGARLPGVGLSIGLSRLLGRVFERGLVAANRSTPACVLVALPSDEARPAAEAVAWTLRRRGIACEVFHKAQKYGKQLDFAARRGIPYVWFPGTPHEVKDLRSKEQREADPAVWTPDGAEGVWGFA